jgi:hypothetical protein
MLNAQYLNLMVGGKNGGKYIATGTANAAMDLLYVAADTVFTTLTDSADKDLVASKVLTGLTVPAGVILSAGTGLKIKAVSYSSGTVFGYTLETSSNV